MQEMAKKQEIGRIPNYNSNLELNQGEIRL